MRKASVLLVAFLSTVALGQNVTLSMAPARARPGGTVVVPIKLASAGGAETVGIQWSLIYSSDITDVSMAIGNAGTIAHKTLSCNGNLCFVAALNQTIIPDGTVAIATFHIAPKPFAQSIPIQISGVVAASAVAQSIPVKSVSGTIALLSNGWVRRFLDCSIWATLIPKATTTTSPRTSDL